MSQISSGLVKSGLGGERERGGKLLYFSVLADEVEQIGGQVSSFHATFRHFARTTFASYMCSFAPAGHCRPLHNHANEGNEGDKG